MKKKIIYIALTVIIGLAALGGWRLYKQQTNNSAPKPSVKSTAPISQNSAQNQPANKYLVINEWGVKFAVPENRHGDISYIMNDKAQRDFGGPVRVDFTSSAFNKGSTKCAQVESDPYRALLSIYRESVNDDATTDPAPFKQLGGYRYYFTKTSCEQVIENSGSASDKQLLQELKQAITTTLETI